MSLVVDDPYPLFSKWWSCWPKSPRKGGKSGCLKKWQQAGYEAQAEEIIRHTQWMATTPDWQKDNGSFIPMPSTYLNQMRWDGAEIPETVNAHEQTQLYLASQPKGTPVPAEVRERLALVARGKRAA